MSRSVRRVSEGRHGSSGTPRSRSSQGRPQARRAYAAPCNPPAARSHPEGGGWVSLEGGGSEISAGMTVVAAEGWMGGFEARTRLAFLGVRLGGEG